MFFDIESYTEGDRIASAHDRRREVLMAFDRIPRERIFDPSDRLHGLASFLLFRVIDNQEESISWFEIKPADQLRGLQLKGLLGRPTEKIEEIIETAPMMPRVFIEMSIERRNITPTPRENDQQN